VSPRSAPAGLRERKKAQRTERILDAAESLLRENPHDAITLQQIARAADVSEMTIFNLVGNRAQIWAALAERALAAADLDPAADGDPLRRARGIIESTTNVVVANPAVFRAVMQSWTGTARVVVGDPTSPLEECFIEAKEIGVAHARIRPRHSAELVSASLLGVMHQWAARVIDDRALRTRSRELVEIAFAAARP
jgi:AcrR family transcriptional regulator